MKLEKLNWDKKSNRLTVLLKDSEEGFTNAIRRLILEEVPVLAVEDLEIKENSSALYDEMIALRLGLSPIKTDLKSYSLKEECKCDGEGCVHCELKMVLKGSKKGYVYATDAESKDSKCKFVHKMPIVKLISKQKIEMQLTAILGKGKEHAKWSPGWIWFYGWPEFKITGKSDINGCVKECGGLESKGGTLKIKDITKWNDANEEICEKHGIEVINSEKDIVFNVESWGQLSCKEMLDVGVDVLLGKLDEFEGLL